MRCSGFGRLVLAVAVTVATIALADLIANAAVKVENVPTSVATTAAAVKSAPAGPKPITVATAEAASAPAVAPDAPAAGPGSISGLLASANVEAGQKYAKACAACHTFEKGAPNRVGPNLYGVVGRKAGSAEGFAYSASMKAMADKTWDFETLNQMLFNPKGLVAGTKMAYAGIKNDQDRANVIAWLRTLSDSPVALPAK